MEEKFLQSILAQGLNKNPPPVIRTKNAPDAPACHMVPTLWHSCVWHSQEALAK